MLSESAPDERTPLLDPSATSDPTTSQVRHSTPLMLKIFGEKFSGHAQTASRTAQVPRPPPGTPATPHTPDLPTSEDPRLFPHGPTCETAHIVRSAQPSSQLSKFLTKYNPGLTLENSGSVARDHLASERTFLAYVRTSLAVASTGVVLVQLFTISGPSGSGLSSNGIQKYARPLGATCVCLGMAVLGVGIARYFSIQLALTKGKFPVARIAVGGIALGLTTMVIVVFGVLVTVSRRV